MTVFFIMKNLHPQKILAFDQAYDDM